jgi:tetratricopeptide (TPR) repeat protein
MVLLFAVTAGLLAQEPAGLPAETQATPAIKDPLFSIGLNPGVAVALGADTAITNLGFGAELFGRLRIPIDFPLRVRLGGGYDLVPLGKNPLDVNVTLHLLSAQAGIEAGITPVPKLFIGAYGVAGYYLALVAPDNETGGSNPLFGGGLLASYQLGPSFSLGLDAAYRYYYGLYDTLQIGLTASFTLGARPAATTIQIAPQQQGPQPLQTLDLSKAELNAFPAFYKYYATHPIGTLSLENKGATEIKITSITLAAKDIMDNPTEAAVKAPSIPAGAQVDVDIFAFFNNSVLSKAERDKKSVNVVVEGEADGQKFRNEFVRTLNLYGRNDTTWDDDRRAAAFVTARDATVSKFAKNISSMVAGRASRMIDENLLAAVAMHEALALYGLKYQVDPTSSYEKLSASSTSIDYLQFPRQTLENLSGDCDDLSILYCSLLEALGVPSAFITVPGHIYTAFALKLSAQEAQSIFATAADLIVARDGVVWVPVEVTSIDGGFIKAWSTGAKEWREWSAKSQAQLWPISEAWKLYESVPAYSGDAATLYLPADYKVTAVYLEEIMRFIDQQIGPKVAELNKTITATNDIRAINRLGVLYAKYGKTNEARAEFLRIIAKNEYVPALVNLGNLALQAEDITGAEGYYARAKNKEPNNVGVLIGLAKLYYEQEKWTDAKNLYAQVKRLDATVAAQFAYLDQQGEQASRAADESGAKTTMYWPEEAAK